MTKCEGRRRAHPAYAVAALLAVAVPACGGSGGSDQALAERAVLREQDVSVAGADIGTWYSDQIEKESVAGRCLALDLPKHVATGRATSDEFTAMMWIVASAAAVYERLADDSAARLADAVAECIRRQRTSNAPIFGVPVGRPKVRELPFPSVGQQSAAREVRTGFGPLAVTDVVVVTRTGRALGLLYVSPEDDGRAVMVRLAEAVASRMSPLDARSL